MSNSGGSSVTFADIGGLKEQIQAIKEMVLLPRMYSSLTQKFGLKAPRGVLFHGPPGTGKTLLASALANECCIGGRQVTFISRKGADILGSYLGQSENQLRQVFEHARRNSPSVIFFDEIDALAPSRETLCKSSHAYASVVSVLLTEMDGIGTSTGSDIFVVGATNRLDSIDPALRRPGRFDRELLFSLPSREERSEIITVHTTHWKPPMPADLVDMLARRTHGHCGADLQAILGETLMCCLRRTHPNIADCARKMAVRKSKLQVQEVDVLLACSKFVPGAGRVEEASARKLDRIMEPVFKTLLNSIVAGLEKKYPYGYLHGGQFSDDGAYGPRRLPRLLLTGSAQHGVTQHLAPAILHHFEHLPVACIDLALCVRDASGTNKACLQAIRRAKASAPSILYLPDITSWWDTVDEPTRALVSCSVADLPEKMRLMLVATANTPYEDLPEELQHLFLEGLAVEAPGAAARERFFEELILNEPGRSPLLARDRSPPRTSSSSSGSDHPRRLPAPPSSRSTQRERDLEARRKRAERRGSGESYRKSMDKPGSSKDAAPGEGRRAILERLVSATAGFPSLPLERVYGDLSVPLSRCVCHDDEHRLLQELQDVVENVERQARDRTT